MKKYVVIIVLMVVSGSPLWSRTNPPATSTQEEIRIQKATIILEELAGIPEKGIPQWVVQGAEALVIVPNLVKAGLVVGGEHGKGIAIARKANGEWSDPLFVDLTAGSFGFQAGVQSSDVVLVFKRKNSLAGMGKNKLTLGGDISVAAGPVGRHSSAATDGKLEAEIYSYSRSRGLFAGISLEGAVLSINDRANDEFYDHSSVVADEIFEGKLQSDNEAVKELKETLAKLEE